MDTRRRNQRQLIFGLGDQDLVQEVQLQWPSGCQQTFRDLPADRHIVLVEGQAEPVVLFASDRSASF